ncbi:hypothetical protein ACFSK2_38190 [Streptomyces beijiangensis]
MEKIPGPPPAYCQGKEAVGDAVEGAVGSAFAKIVDSFSEGAAKVVKELATGWLQVNAPTLDKDTGPVAFLMQSTGWLTAYLAVLALLFAAGRMAWERRGEPAKEALAGILRLLIVSGCGVAAINLLVKGGDEFAAWLIQRSTSCSGAPAGEACVDAFGDRLLKLTVLGATNNGMMALILVLALILMLSSLMQLLFVLVRGAMLIILAGTLPLTAAAYGTTAGKAMFQKSLGWLLAFIAYKPAAAIVYAAGFSSLGAAKDDDLMTQLSGIVLLILSGLTLPALMRVAAPLVDGIASSQKGALATAAGAAQSIASGAIAVKSLGGAKAAQGAAGAVGKSAGNGPGPQGGNAPGGTPPPGNNPPGNNTPGGNGQSPQGGNTPGVPPQSGNGQGPQGGTNPNTGSPGTAAPSPGQGPQGGNGTRTGGNATAATVPNRPPQGSPTSGQGGKP